MASVYFPDAPPPRPAPAAHRAAAAGPGPAARSGAARSGASVSRAWGALGLGFLKPRKRRFRHLVRSFPWLFSKSSEQERWWRHHPRPGDLLIGWVMHPKLTQGNKTDLEAEFSSGCGGLWRSRGLAFRGKFSSTVQDGQLTLQDEATTLKGRMREASLSIQGSVIHEGSPGGEFILRPLPECYREWWSQVKGKLEDPNPGFLVLNEDGSFEGGDASDEDASSFPDITSPAELRKFLLLRRITQQVGSQRRPSPRRSKRQELLFKFALRPDEVKEYLDRYVICQTAAKEMLAVAICDHYNRAKEELLSSSPESESSESAVAVDSKADESKDPSEAVPEPAAEDSESRKSSETLDQVVFKDTDDDVILLQLDGDRVREFVNGELELEQVELFEIDVAQREYKDDSGRGKFQDEQDVTKIQQQVAGLFARAAKAALLKPARVKNYTKPNILLLGPTGSGKTYLLRNLADLIGVPFVKADATKFTETGYVGRDADEVMGELLQAADGDVELAQVGIVYVDEIDKVCSEGDGRTSSFRRATQSTFLKLMEDTEVTVGSGGPRSILGGLGGDKGVKLSTRHVLFVFSGAFSQLDEKLKEEHMRNAKGFGFTRDASEKWEEVKSMLHKADTEELVKAGMEREFVGRLPVRVALQALSEDDLFQVLTKAEEGATAQLVDDFRRYGIELRFTEEALKAVAQKAAKEATGARALVTVLENTLRRYKYSMPALVPKGCTTLEVGPDLIANPDKELQNILQQHDEALQIR